MSPRETDSICTVDGIDLTFDPERTEYLVQAPHEVSEAAAWVADGAVMQVMANRAQRGGRDDSPRGGRERPQPVSTSTAGRGGPHLHRDHHPRAADAPLPPSPAPVGHVTRSRVDRLGSNYQGDRLNAARPVMSYKTAQNQL